MLPLSGLQDGVRVKAEPVRGVFCVVLRIAAGAVVVAAPAAAARAAGSGTGSIVVRVSTDPSPPGVDWAYAVGGQSFRLGLSRSERTVSGLTDGTYSVKESTQAGQPPTLTALSCVDPSGNSTVALPMAAATVVVDSGETVTCTFAHRALGPRPAAPAAKLAARYAPQLRLASGEHYRPLRLEDFVASSALRVGVPPHGALAQAHPTLFTLPVSSAPTYLDIRDIEPNVHPSRYASLEQSLDAARPRSTVYFHLAYQPSEQRVAIEYWFLYVYNDFYDKHEGDWEGITVFLQNGEPIGAAYSQHQGRKWIPWTDVATSGAHPVVYVGRGSHADYPKTGSYSVRVCWTLYGRHCTPSPRVDAAPGNGTSLGPSSYDLQSLGGTGYSGGWGSGNYILGVGRTRDRISDPRRRAEYTNPFSVVPA